MVCDERTGSSRTRIFAICVLRNEADVIGQCLRSAARWAHRIYVCDNGSDDGSWEIVSGLAAELGNVEIFGRDTRAFQPAMRRGPFVANRHLCADGDWWMILDADEFYRDDPRDFLDAVPKVFQAVENVSIAFCMSDADLARYEADPAAFADDVPVHEKMRHYLANYAELRFFRHDRYLRWFEKEAWPATGAIFHDRIPTLHYVHRSPQQIQRRIDVRRAAVREGTTSFRHELRRSADWRGRIVPAAAMRYDAHDGAYVIDPGALPSPPLFARIPPWMANALRRWKVLLDGAVRRAVLRRLTGSRGMGHDGPR